MFLKDFNFKEYIFFIFPVFIIAVKISMPVLDYDALSYHLNLGHIYIMNNGFLNLKGFLFFSFPQFSEMIYTGILLLFPIWTAQLLPFIFFVLAVVLTEEIYKEIYGFKDKFLSLILFSTPCFIFYSATAYVDIILMYYVLFSFYLYKRGYFSLSSFFSGISFSVKYTGITAVIGLFFMLLIFHRKKISCIFYSIIPFLPYLFKNIYYFKNPVYPFLSNDYLNYFRHIQEHGIGLNLKTLLLPYYLTYEGIRFGLGFDFIGPVYLILFILFLISFKGEIFHSNEKKIVLFLLPSLIIWVFKSQVLRFLLPYIPLILILLIKQRKKIYSSVLYAAIFYNIIFSFYIFSNIGGFEFLSRDRKSFLREKHPSYKGFEYLNREKGNLNILFYGETRGTYLNKFFIPVSVFDKNHLIEILDKKDTSIIYEELKKSYTHIFVSKFEIKRLGDNFTSSILDRQKKEKLLKLFLKFKKVYEDKNSIIYRL